MKFQLSFKGTVRERLDAITSMCNLLAQQMFYGKMKDQENLNAEQENTNALTLELAADHEERLCMMELGI